jgi:membrane protein implicated in regulation of membrane protease activity
VFTFFLICAAVGGTILVCQFVMTLTGFGGDHDAGGHGHFGDVGHGDAGDAGHVGADHHSGDAVSHDHDLHEASKLTWLFSFISLRSVVAGLTFFGLAGLASRESGLSTEWTMAIALLSGLAAMYAVTMIMKAFGKLAHDGTVRIQNALGKRGTVYIPIPGGKAGAGKVQLKVQNRVVEYAAVTSEPDKLPTGTQVEVVDITNSNVLEVKLVREPAKL